MDGTRVRVIRMKLKVIKHLGPFIQINSVDEGKEGISLKLMLPDQPQYKDWQNGDEASILIRKEVQQWKYILI